LQKVRWHLWPGKGAHKGKHVSGPFPTWTICAIAGLAQSGLIIEIKAVVVARA
jgi:hypothetical protein